jgi:ParB family chromosome partitioning protein
LLVLVERFGYTHEEVARKIGRSRSSVTEALAIAALPTEIRETCRRADISSKSLLLQVARQPDEEAMRKLVKRISEQGMTRDEARRARSQKQAHQQPYLFRYHAPNRDYALELRFRRSSVSQDEVVQALEQALTTVREGSH